MANIEKADYVKFLHDMENHNGCSFMDAMKGMSIGEQLKAVHDIVRLSQERSDKNAVQIYESSKSFSYQPNITFELWEKTGFLGFGDTKLFGETWYDGNVYNGTKQQAEYVCSNNVTRPVRETTYSEESTDPEKR